MVLAASDTTEILTAIFTGLTVVLASIALIVAAKALNHDRVQTGTRRPIIARRGKDRIPWNKFNDDPLPQGWIRNNTRWVPIRLINRARYSIDVDGPSHARLGLFRRGVQVATSGTREVGPNEPLWYFVRMQNPTGWGSRRKVRLRLRWEAAEGRVRFRGWVTLKDVPPEPGDANNSG